VVLKCRLECNDDFRAVGSEQQRPKKCIHLGRNYTTTENGTLETGRVMGMRAAQIEPNLCMYLRIFNILRFVLYNDAVRPVIYVWFESVRKTLGKIHIFCLKKNTS
jgi:hypothetical protein